MRPETRTDVRAEFRDGLIAVVPACIAVVPFSLLLGAMAHQKGLSVLEIMLMSGLVFAGSSQFVALDIWTDPVPWVMVTVSALMINSRHLLMGASISPKIAHFSTGQSYLALFLMADEIWALCERRSEERRIALAYWLGIAVPLYLNWVAWTGFGAALGAVFTDPAAYGFDFAFTALFLTIIVGLWRGPSTGVAIAASAATASLVYLTVDGPWYIAAGGIAGALAGALFSPRIEMAAAEAGE